ncbi:MAG: sulfurtransferase complex subunit TusB [Gammaproteobacteria bacterium]|nr:MAG: sulfurtransferase complex subunit TusB [Gammaproteobacteria bacterium]
MAMLHTVNKSPFERNTLDSCIAMAKSGSSVLLIEDGIYAALKGTAASAKVSKAMESVTFYVLGPDLNARGMTEDQLIDGIKVVDYAGFVDLTAEHENFQAWL